VQLLLDLNKVINRSWVELGNRIYHLDWSIVQQAEQRIVKPQVVGMEPTAGATSYLLVQLIIPQPN